MNKLLTALLFLTIITGATATNQLLTNNITYSGTAANSGSWAPTILTDRIANNGGQTNVFNTPNWTIDLGPSSTSWNINTTDFQGQFQGAANGVTNWTVQYSFDDVSFTTATNFNPGSSTNWINQTFPVVSGARYWRFIMISNSCTNGCEVDDMGLWGDTSNSTPVVTNITCTDCQAPGNTSPYYTSDTTPTFTFTTNVTANCRIASTNWNYTTMGSTRNCTSGDGTFQHHCTLTSQDALSPAQGNVYFGCQNTLGNQQSASSAGPLLVIGIATSPQIAEDDGIQASVVWPGATVYNNQQVFLRNLSGSQVLATVDRVVVFGNQRWLFNYNNLSTLGLFNITPVVYSFEMANMSFLQIEQNVTTFINNTKQ